MPGGGAQRDDRPSRRIDLPYHLVAGASAQGPRKQRRAARPRLGANPRHRSRSRSIRPASDDPSHRLFLDADGVLADFDQGVPQAPRPRPDRIYWPRTVRGAFWRELSRAKNFYGTLPEMADARQLFDAVEHLKPTILTGLPLGNWAARQKVEWAAEHFPGVSDHHLHGARQAQAYEAGRRAGRRSRKSPGRLRGCRRGLRASQECRG